MLTDLVSFLFLAAAILEQEAHKIICVVYGFMRLYFCSKFALLSLAIVHNGIKFRFIAGTYLFTCRLNAA